MQNGIKRYAGVITVAAAFIIVVIIGGGNLSDPELRKELIYCSAGIIAAVVMNQLIQALFPRKAGRTTSYIGWLLISLAIAFKSAGPEPFLDPGASIGLTLVFIAGLVLLAFAYLKRGRLKKRE